MAIQSLPKLVDGVRVREVCRLADHRTRMSLLEGPYILHRAADRNDPMSLAH
jgi:hypothetical protein